MKVRQNTIIIHADDQTCGIVHFLICKKKKSVLLWQKRNERTVSWAHIFIRFHTQNSSQEIPLLKALKYIEHYRFFF